MAPSNRALSTLELLLPQWRRLLQGWAADDSLSHAARDALQLAGRAA